MISNIIFTSKNLYLRVVSVVVINQQLSNHKN